MTRRDRSVPGAVHGRVVTRLPPPHRIAPGTALELLEGNLLARRCVLALDARGYRGPCRRVADDHVAGGRSCDAVITECALHEPDTVLLTLNATDFAGFAGRGLAVVVPGQ